MTEIATAPNPPEKTTGIARDRWKRNRAKAALLLAAALSLLLATCSTTVPLLSRVESNGILHVAATDSPTTCYRGPDGPAGFECELLGRLAAHLGVKLRVHYYANGPKVLSAVAAGDADIGSAGLIVNDRQTEFVRFTSPLRYVTQKVIYRMGEKRPRTLKDLQGSLEVVANSPAEIALAQRAAGNHPALHWKTTDQFGSEDLLYKVSRGQLDYTVANSDLTAINQRYYPNLLSGFDISAPQPVGWILRLTHDKSLYTYVQHFLAGLGKATLSALHQRYFSRKNRLNYLGVVRFTKDVKQLLPKYRKAFLEAAKKNHLNWRLLAAIGYQESRWNPDAVSPTGVRGLMMLTDDTASQLDVKNRVNPLQSIDGAARYLAQLLNRLPKSVKPPDRTWMALAAYNMGFGHLLDARTLTKNRGGNPNLWKDVKTSLPLLMREHWYSQTRNGYARGGEALMFVKNVRSYYDILVWFTGGEPVLIRHARSPTAETPQGTVSHLIS